MQSETKLQGWSKTHIKDVAVVNALTVDKKYPYKDIQYIDIASVDLGRIKATQRLLLREAPSRAKRIVRDQDILISTVRPNLRHYCYVKSAKNNTVASTGFAVVSVTKADPYFLYCLLTTDSYTEYLTRIAEGHTSAYPSFNPEVIENSSFLLPPLPEQEAIAAVLSSLDDKIELLRRQNETLEKIAQTIFKEWFVEFNFPDKNGKPYKASGGKMVDSDLGPIPDGWRLVSLYDVAKYNNGAAFRQDDFSSKNAGLPIIKIAELKDGLTANTKYTEKSVSEDIILQDDDILFSWSGSPETSIDIFVWHLGKGILNQHTFRVVPHKSAEKVWVYNLLRHYKSLFVELAKQKQTTGLGHVTVTDLKDTKTVCPDEGLLTRYNEVVKPIFAKYCLNLKAVSTLARTRDALLPKLMSGALRVKGDMD